MDAINLHSKPLTIGVGGNFNKRISNMHELTWQRDFKSSQKETLIDPDMISEEIFLNSKNRGWEVWFDFFINLYG